MVNTRIDYYICVQYSTYFVNRNVLRKVDIQIMELRTRR